MFMVVSYDIVDDRRRMRVCNTLKNYGRRVQYSVFECDLKQADVERLQQKLRRLIKTDEDSVRFYFLCESCVRRVQVIGQGEVPKRRDFYLV